MGVARAGRGAFNARTHIGTISKRARGFFGDGSFLGVMRRFASLCVYYLMITSHWLT